ncbi:hypothetical protein [Aldersonia kunmingensis]|uniref:hypothetical protein n=1 Tax=Aldersonia kunmingensis TaxID=408066 RepID=UPI0008376BD4|nr:hypothetical protein [Aldersonia kunmingensis]
MTEQAVRRWPLTRVSGGSGLAEAFLLITVATILGTRAYLELSGYPQVGGRSLHIAHALYGGAAMVVALLICWLLLGAGVRVAAVIVGGVGFGLFLDEVGKFVTKDNDYFYGPSAEIMYISVFILLIASRITRDIRPLSANECLASAASIAADGVARGIAPHRRVEARHLIDRALAGGADAEKAAHVRALVDAAPTAPARLRAVQVRAQRLIPDFFRSPRWIPVVGWLTVVTSFLSFALGVTGISMGGVYYDDDNVKLELEGASISSVILLVSATITFALSLPAMIARTRTTKVWPLQWLRYAALVFTFLNALVDFAVEGFGAVTYMAIGLFTLAIVTYHLNLAMRAQSVLPAPEAVATGR